MRDVRNKFTSVTEVVPPGRKSHLEMGKVENLIGRLFTEMCINFKKLTEFIQ